MNELPPDPPRLRKILRHLEDQLADNETVGTYLRLQRDTVRTALAEAERPRQDARPSRPQRLGRPPTRPGQFLLEPKASPKSPEPALVHVWNCSLVARNVSVVNAHDARLALTQELVGAEPCPVCRPDTVLGLLD